MNLKDKIDLDYKNSLKSKDKTKISTYRLILSGIKDLDIANRSLIEKKETNNEDIKKLIKKMIKQRSESIDVYKKNNREDLLKVEQQEYEILSSYLPKQLDVNKKLKATNIKHLGKVMAELKTNFSDNLDFALASKILKDLLNK